MPDLSEALQWTTRALFLGSDFKSLRAACAYYWPRPRMLDVPLCCGTLRSALLPPSVQARRFCTIQVWFPGALSGSIQNFLYR